MNIQNDPSIQGLGMMKLPGVQVTPSSPQDKIPTLDTLKKEAPLDDLSAGAKFTLKFLGVLAGGVGILLIPLAAVGALAGGALNVIVKGKHDPKLTPFFAIIKTIETFSKGALYGGIATSGPIFLAIMCFQKANEEKATILSEKDTNPLSSSAVKEKSGISSEEMTPIETWKRDMGVIRASIDEISAKFEKDSPAEFKDQIQYGTGPRNIHVLPQASRKIMELLKDTENPRFFRDITDFLVLIIRNDYATPELQEAAENLLKKIIEEI